MPKEKRGTPRRSRGVRKKCRHQEAWQERRLEERPEQRLKERLSMEEQQRLRSRPQCHRHIPDMRALQRTSR